MHDIAELEARHRHRRARWADATARRAAAELSYRERVGDARKQLEVTLRGPKLAELGGLLGRARLYAGALVYRRESHELTPAVNVRVEQEGNVSVAQGWIVKTQHDSRTTYVTVEGPDWTVTVRGAKGTSAITDAGAALSNFSYRMDSRTARDFAAEVRSAAARSDTFRQDNAEAIDAARRRLEDALTDTAALVAVIEEQTALLRQADDARQDLADTTAALTGAPVSRSRRLLRQISRDLEREIADYRVEPPPADVTSRAAASAGEAAAAASVVDGSVGSADQPSPSGAGVVAAPPPPPPPPAPPPLSPPPPPPPFSPPPPPPPSGLSLSSPRSPTPPSEPSASRRGATPESKRRVIDASASTASADAVRAHQLQQLVDLRRAGILDDSEFAAKVSLLHERWTRDDSAMA